MRACVQFTAGRGAGAGESPYGLYTPRTRRIEPVGIRVVQRVLREVVALLVRHVAVALVDVAELLVAPRRRARELPAVFVRTERSQLRVVFEALCKPVVRWVPETGVQSKTVVMAALATPQQAPRARPLQPCQGRGRAVDHWSRPPDAPRAPPEKSPQAL